MTIEDVFKGAENGTLTFEQFNQAAGNAKFVDLSDGGYISQGKHDTEIRAKDKQIETLNGTISQRDTDLESLQKQLDEAGGDAAKLSDLSTQFDTLKAKYDEDTKSYQNQLAKQAREFAIKEYAATKKFSSSAARRDYIASMIGTEDVKLKKDGKLSGFAEFDEDYSKENLDAFFVEKAKDAEPDGGTEPGNSGNQLPMFSQQTPGEPFKDNPASGGFGFSFIPQS